MRDLTVWTLSLRLGVAALAGLTLGFERELRARAAGLRTHSLVAVGAALFTIAGAYGFADIPRGPNVDPARIAAQVASGVGFLGAGAILRHGPGVRGLTTAATVWLAAAIGVACGAGGYPAVAVATVVVLLVLVGMRLVKPLIARWSVVQTVIELDYRRGHGTLGPVLRTINGLQTRLEHFEIEDEGESEADGLRHVSLYLNVHRLDDVYAAA